MFKGIKGNSILIGMSIVMIMIIGTGTFNVFGEYWTSNSVGNIEGSIIYYNGSNYCIDFPSFIYPSYNYTYYYQPSYNYTPYNYTQYISMFMVDFSSDVRKDHPH